MKLAISVIGLLVISACGRNEILNTQESARDDMREELTGRWNTPCEGSRTRTIDVTPEKVTFEFTTFLDAECQEKVRTVAHSANYKLSHNYKTGINNSMILTPDNDVVVTLHTDTEVEVQNNGLIELRNAKETPIPQGSSLAVKTTTTRNNEKLRQAKNLGNWLRGKPQTLNRFQLEKLNENTGFVLNVGPVAEQGARVSVRYELDNGFLQIGNAVTGAYTPTGNPSFGLNGVFAKQ